MRDIKFRAWDKVDLQIVDFYKLLEDYNIGFILKCPELTVNIVLLQYTGVKDKNGREIYEGDIVKYKYGEDVDSYDLKPERVYERMGAVEFDRGEFYPRPYYKYCEDGWYSTIHYDFEIIGNIYENPELLEVE